MKYEIIYKSWSKRRELDPPIAVKSIQFVQFKKQHNHFCQMLVEYQDLSQETLHARVIFNDIKKTWSVDGLKVAVRLLEE